jgi:hypothetical protein
VPVKGYSEAYDGGGGVVGAATGLVDGAFGLLSSTVGYLGSVIGYGAAPPAQQGQTTSSVQGQGQQPASANTAPDGSIRVRTLADQRAREPRREFYNGNQVCSCVTTELEDMLTYCFSWTLSRITRTITNGRETEERRIGTGTLTSRRRYMSTDITH